LSGFDQEHAILPCLLGDDDDEMGSGIVGDAESDRPTLRMTWQEQLFRQGGAGASDRFLRELLRLRNLDGARVLAQRLAHALGEVDFVLRIDRERRLEQCERCLSPPAGGWWIDRLRNRFDGQRHEMAQPAAGPPWDEESTLGGQRQPEFELEIRRRDRRQPETCPGLLFSLRDDSVEVTLRLDDSGDAPGQELYERLGFILEHC
jgi:hypothetical protein